jgi:hypothetical protein
MNGQTGIIVLWIVIGFFGFVTIVCGTLFWIFWRRRKLTFLNFLSDTGMWERISLMPDKLDTVNEYDGCFYKFDILKCTHDKINRAVAHYNKGNPEQLQFKYSENNKKIVIQNTEISMKDFVALMLSKVIKDIFSDDEVMTWLMMILISVVVMGIIIIIVVATKKVPPVTLADNNATVDLIVRSVKIAISRG